MKALTKLTKLALFLSLTSSTLFAGAETFYEHRKVMKSEPIYEYIYETKSNQECYEEQIKVPQRRANSFNSNSIGLDTIIGATTGVIVGNQIGKGNGRTAAKIIGGILGGAVANKMRNQHSPSDYNQNHTYETRTQCYDRPITTKKKMITGYKNYFVYNGNEHFNVSKKPRKKVKIRHTIDF